MKTKHSTRSLASYHLAALLTIMVSFNLLPSMAQDGPVLSGADKLPMIGNSEQVAKVFDEASTKALAAMKARAEELKMQGVAVVAYIQGENTTSWSSKMVVVGAIKTASSEKDPGVNLLAIAYSKAAEMADTLKASGSGIRPPMKGEFGWQGGLVKKGKAGYLIATFSGGKSEDDVKVSQTGLDVLGTSL